LDERDVEDLCGHSTEGSVRLELNSRACCRRECEPVANDADILDFSLGSHGV
jgi:hypothetical protein